MVKPRGVDEGLSFTVKCLRIPLSVATREKIQRTDFHSPFVSGIRPVPG